MGWPPKTRTRSVNVKKKSKWEYLVAIINSYPSWWEIMQTQENMVLLVVSGLVLGLFRGPLGSWVYGLGPPRPGLGALM